jgi:hypothetical protein
MNLDPIRYYVVAEEQIRVVFGHPLRDVVRTPKDRGKPWTVPYGIENRFFVHGFYLQKMC